MTTTITTGRNSVTNFTGYMENFNATFLPSSFTSYKHEVNGVFYGVYGASEGSLFGPSPQAAGYIIGNGYGAESTPQTVSRLLFGNGVFSTGDDLQMSAPRYTVEFAPVLAGAPADKIIDEVQSLGKFSKTGVDALLDMIFAEDVVFFGAGGGDVFTGTNNADHLNGKAGDDTLKGGKNADTILGGTGSDSLKGGNGHDTIKGQKGADVVSGGKGNDTIFGGNGKNTLKGGADNDEIQGGAKADTIKGGGGADTMNAGGGINTVTGGKGADHFVFTGAFKKTVIKDFGRGNDQLDFSNFSNEATSLAQFKNASTERKGKVIYDMGGDDQNKIVLLDTDLSDLSASDFIF
ncbi:calcium-binding protein [Chachezhania antarctica]|uniref:calcium-binding protein n=1 Tax=Chachezhania antarctica TaxID=2340860 RepID=UPI000EADE7AA|nr:calcium-binding protein [Chachezhania antarctica]|tara:strand:+ start:9512 stop:10558 length:1047 start_codon:yes stop_codon:yes gene_type:complete